MAGKKKMRMQLLVGPFRKDDCVPNRGAAVLVRRPPALQPVFTGAFGIKNAVLQFVRENPPRLATIVVLNQNLGREPVAADGAELPVSHPPVRQYVLLDFRAPGGAGRREEVR